MRSVKWKGVLILSVVTSLFSSIVVADESIVSSETAPQKEAEVVPPQQLSPIPAPGSSTPSQGVPVEPSNPKPASQQVEIHAGAGGFFSNGAGYGPAAGAGITWNKDGTARQTTEAGTMTVRVQKTVTSVENGVATTRLVDETKEVPIEENRRSRSYSSASASALIAPNSQGVSYDFGASALRGYDILFGSSGAAGLQGIVHYSESHRPESSGLASAGSLMAGAKLRLAIKDAALAFRAGAGIGEFHMSNNYGAGWEISADLAMKIQGLANADCRGDFKCTQFVVEYLMRRGIRSEKSQNKFTASLAQPIGEKSRVALQFVVNDSAGAPRKEIGATALYELKFDETRLLGRAIGSSPR